MVPAIGVVLDEDQVTRRAEVLQGETKHLELVALEMQRVRHHDPVERGQLERLREVGGKRRDGDIREGVSERPQLDPQGAAVPVDRVDRAGGTEKVGQGEGERSLARPEVGPGRATPADALPEQSDVVAVVHGEQSGAGWARRWRRPTTR